MELDVQTTTALEAIGDVLATISKLVGRPAVARQVIAILFVLLLAYPLSRLFIWAAGRVHARWIGQKRQEVGQPAAEDERVRAEVRVVRPLMVVVRQLAYPVAGLLMTYVAVALFAQLGWIAGLLRDFAFVVWLYMAYRLVVAVLLLLFDRKRVQNYRYRLMAPLFVLLILYLTLSLFTDVPQLLAAPLWQGEEAPVPLFYLLLATLGLYLWFVLMGLLKDVALGFFSRRPDVNEGALAASLTLVSYALIAAGIVVAISLLGVSTTTLAAVTGGLSVGIGFALQDVLKNFLGGIILLFEGSVRPGDWVDINGIQGTVQNLSIRATTVRTLNEIDLIVPNQNWLTSVVTTYTRTARRAQAQIPVGIAYNEDVERAQELLLDLALSHPAILAEPAPGAPIVGFGENSIDLLLLAWVRDAEEIGPTQAQLRLEIWRVFKEHDIEMPFPQRDLWIRGGLPQPFEVTPENGVKQQPRREAEERSSL